MRCAGGRVREEGRGIRGIDGGVREEAEMRCGGEGVRDYGEVVRNEGEEGCGRRGEVGRMIGKGGGVRDEGEGVSDVEER